MVSSKALLTLVASSLTFSSVHAFTGFGKHWDIDGNTNCGIFCDPISGTKIVRVALPEDLVPNPISKCCKPVHISYKGVNIDALFTDFYTKGAHSQNISLSDDAFQLLAPLSEKELFPVVWNF